EDTQALRRGQAAAGEVAQRWVADGRAAERLQHLAELALQEASGLTDPAAARTLAARFDAANRARDLLRSTVRADLAVAESLLAWC
ncbi:MAG: DNA polymerase III subunit delta', partial [Thermomonas sp.]